MPKTIFAVCFLASWSAGGHASNVLLNCATPDTAYGANRNTAMVERDASSVIVETRQWIGKWRIEQKGDLGFRAELAAAEIKSGASQSRKQEVLRDVETMTINMTGPVGGFVAGRRYPCAITEQRIAHL